MKIAFVASEAVPYAKTGGLADVVGTLPKYLEKLGLSTAIILPRYRGIEGEEILKTEIDIAGEKEIKFYKKDNAYFIDYPDFFDRSGLYGTPTGDYPDNCERFTLFCKGALKLVEILKPDIVHCHDWQTGLLPLYIRRAGLKIKTVFTIHNLGYQGRFGSEKFNILGIEPEYFTPEGIEYYGGINLLKAGILYSDAVTTVSPTYANEIQSQEYGFGLDGVLRKEKNKLTGILNGIDYEVWNPQRDNLIYQCYNDYKGKQVNKIGITNECLFDYKRPLLGMVSRIAGQKGFDILIKVLDDIITLNYNFIFLGFGDEEYSQKLKTFERSYPNRVMVNIKFDETLAHRIYAGSDFFLMPSRYEPCGLGQMISLRYGTVPIVHKTGGLADTVFQFNPQDFSGNGFLFEVYSRDALFATLKTAYEIYCNSALFETLSENCMKYDFSWNRSASEYKKLYSRLLV